MPETDHEKMTLNDLEWSFTLNCAFSTANDSLACMMWFPEPTTSPCMKIDPHYIKM